jgi:hypothetical protein
MQNIPFGILELIEQDLPMLKNCNYLFLVIDSYVNVNLLYNKSTRNNELPIARKAKSTYTFRVSVCFIRCSW